MGGELTHAFSFPMDPEAGPLRLLPSGHPYGLVCIGSTLLPAHASRSPRNRPSSAGRSQAAGTARKVPPCSLNLLSLLFPPKPSLAACGVWQSPDFLLHRPVTHCHPRSPRSDPAGPGEGKEQAANSASRWVFNVAAPVIWGDGAFLVHFLAAAP